jgi:hypothetical protein
VKKPSPGDEFVNRRQSEIMKEIQAQQDEIVRDISTKEHATIVRQELNKKFPDIKFSVVSEHFAGGSAVRVFHFNEDDDGPYSHPREKEIQEFLRQFSGYEGDLMDGGYNVGFVHGGERLRGAMLCSYHGAKKRRKK